MGQPVAVVEKRSSRPGLVRFEANRNLTGMGHERFTSPEQAVGDRPAAVLARRLFETGCVDAVHVYLNVVTVDVRKGYEAGSLKDIIENLYIYYRPGFVPPSYEEPAAEEAPAAAAPDGGGDGGPALSAAAQRVPAHLLERSRLAKERWAAKKGG
jgi:hypothetical protein